MEDRLDSIEKRIEKLEGANAEEAPEESWSAERSRVESACNKLGIVHRMYQTGADYYQKSLFERCKELHAPSVNHLCKSVLFKNTAWDQTGKVTPENAEYYLVIVQYTAKIDLDVLPNFVRNLLGQHERLGKNKYAFRMATQEESDAVTGFKHNGVAPVGLIDPSVALIVSQAITELEPPVIYLGGGQVDLKLQVNVEQFCKATKAFIAPLSIPRDPAELLAGQWMESDAGSPTPSLTEQGQAQPLEPPRDEKQHELLQPTPQLPKDEIDSKGKEEEAPQPVDVETLAPEFNQLDIRVGLITHVERHPESDKLLIEQIDVGETDQDGSPKPRQILSGIAKFYDPEDLVGKKVAVLCNLKPAKLGGIVSTGMVMCATNKDVDALQAVEAPEQAIPGARIVLFGSGDPAEPASAAQVKKKKIWEKIMPRLSLDHAFRASFDGALWSVRSLEDDMCSSYCTTQPIQLPANVS